MNLKKLDRIKFLLILLTFITLPFGYLSRVNFGEVFIGLYYWDILLVLYLTSFLFSIGSRFSAVKNIKIPAYYLWLAAFILYSVFITLNAYRYLDSLSQLIFSAFYLIRWSIYIFSGIALYIDLKNKSLSKVALKNLLIFLGLAISIIGLIQLIILPDFTMLDKSLLWDPHQNRLAGLYFDPNFAGIILTLSLSVLVSDILDKIEGKSAKKDLGIYLFFAFLIFAAVVLTFSRSAWLAVATIIFVIGILKYRWVIPIAVVVIFLVYYAVPRVQTRISGVTDPTDSFYLRFVSWNETYQIAKTNPVFGYGFNTLRYIKSDMGLINYNEGLGDRSDSGSDSSLLLVWVTTGLVGLTLFVIAHIKLLFAALKQSKISNLSLLYTAFLLGLFINSQFINSMFFPALAVSFSVFTALLFVETD